MLGLYMTHRRCRHGIMAYRYAIMSLRVHLPKQPARSRRLVARPRIGLKPDKGVVFSRLSCLLHGMNLGPGGATHFRSSVISCMISPSRTQSAARGKQKEAMMDAQLTDIVESSQAGRVATGFVFTEGPVWHPEGYWLFVDVRANRIYRLVPGGQPEVIRENSGSSNGMTFDLRGRLLICEGDNRQVTRREPDGTYILLAQRLGGKRINRPNDIVTRSDGSIYFTDPAGRLSQEARELGFNGVHRIAPDGTLTNATADTEYPNGIAFSPDERVLYVAITRRDE